MPIYEYRCKSCGHVFERLILASSAAARCPACDSLELDRLISACAVSSDTSRQASLGAAHRKAAAGREARLRDQHRSLHEHFNDSAADGPKPHAYDGVNEND
jgi:putative FmdB family regulatory protein